MTALPIEWQEAVAIVTMCGIFVALSQFGVKLWQDRREFRRKQAQKAVDVITEIQRDGDSSQALMMLDYFGRPFDVPNFERVQIEPRHIVVGLRCDEPAGHEYGNLSPVDIYIRDVFDHFLTQFENVTNMVDVGLVRWSEIDRCFGYYLAIMRSTAYRDVFEKFCTKYGYFGVGAVITDEKRFPSKHRNIHPWLDKLVEVNTP